MYEYYVAARDKAWNVLIECGVSSLPVDLITIANHYNIEVTTYSDCPLTKLFMPEAISGDGFIAPINNKKVIFINDRIKSRGRRCFTLGHELGHGILDHPLDEIITRNDEIDSETNPFEMQANVFSRDTLAPACILDAIGVTTAREIIELCIISNQSAVIRLERLKLLQKRGAFGTSPLERQVLDQFSEYIKNQREILGKK